MTSIGALNFTGDLPRRVLSYSTAYPIFYDIFFSTPFMFTAEFAEDMRIFIINISLANAAHFFSPLNGSALCLFRRNPIFELSPWSGVLWALVAWLILSAPHKAFAEVYTDKQVNDIAIIVDGKVSGKLSRAAFENAVLPLIQAQGVNSELTVKLLQHTFPPMTSKGIDALIAVSKKAVMAKAKQENAATKAKAIADAHGSTIIAHTTAKDAATAAEAAHRAAASDPSKTADAVAKDQVVATAAQKSAVADTAAVLKVDTTSISNTMWSVLLWSGAKLQNPYSITNGAIKPNNTKTDGFLDLELIHRYVLSGDTSGEDNLFFSFSGIHSRSHGGGEWDWFFPGQLFPDLEFRVGYVFGGPSTPTNLTVSTITGGSDFYSDNSIGLPFWRWSKEGSWNQQATIELGGGFVTDKQFLAIHPNYFLGLGYQFSNKDWMWQTRFGLGAADVPHLTTGSTVSTNSIGLPLFDLKQAPSWGTVITYKLSPSVNLQLGANAYFDTRSTWNLSAGVSIDPAVALKGLSK